MADDPGGGEYLVLLTFKAQNLLPGGAEPVSFSQAYRVRSGQAAGVIGFPLCVGLGVGKLGAAFQFNTVNVQDSADEAAVRVLEPPAFTAGLNLLTTPQPALKPLSDLALGLARQFATRNRNKPVQDCDLGLDFEPGAFGARLAVGSYLAVQVPAEGAIRWAEWEYAPGDGGCGARRAAGRCRTTTWCSGSPGMPADRPTDGVPCHGPVGAPQARAPAGVRRAPGERGEGGKLYPPSPQPQSGPPVHSKSLFRQAVVILALVSVVSGRLGLFGNPPSTNPAHPDLIPTAPARSPARARSARPAGPAVGSSYARYSSDLQDESSIDQQQRKCRDRAAADGVPLPPEFEFADRAVSGTKRDRDGLNAFLAAARDGRFTVVYFESLSRLARESVITLPLLKELAYVHRIRVVSVSEGIDSAQPNWELTAGFMAWVHEQYLKALRAAVLRGQEDAVLHDYSVGHWCFGYGSEPIPGSEHGRRGRRPRPRMRVVVDAGQAGWVRQIFAWFVDDGWSVNRIAKELTARSAPKDRRGTAAGWHPQAVRRVLRNEKYVGLWGWGKATNVRNPLTGQIAQEGRPADEVARWVRHRPDLRLVEDGVFARAQAVLDANEARWAAHRAAGGRLRGSKPAAVRPRHLLQGLVKCAACGGTFQVNGARGQYLGCGGYVRGNCPVKTRLPRRAAEAALLAAVGGRLAADPGWVEAVYQEAVRAWEEAGRRAPDDRAATERELAAVDRKIARLVDAVEAGEGAEVAGRLRDRRREKKELELRLARHGPPAAAPAGPPTRDWVAEQVRDLGALLTAGGADAADALRRVVGGAVAVEEVAVPGRKRKALAGTFTLAAGSVLPDIAGGTAGRAEAVRVEFAADPPWAAVADAVKAAFDAGTDYRGIAVAVGCPYPWVAKALAWWHRQRGLAVPDGRTLKARLDRPTLAASLADAAKELWDADLPMGEIAGRLGCDRDTVTAAVRHWFEARSLAVPDGRARRKAVRLRREG